MTENSQDEPGGERVILALAAVTGFKRACATRDDLEIFAQLQSFYTLILREVEPAGGRVVKFIGDAALVTFPLHDPEGVMSRLRGLKAKANTMWHAFDRSCAVHLKAGIGEVDESRLGDPGDEWLEEIGGNVSTLLEARGDDYEVDGGLNELPPS